MENIVTLFNAALFMDIMLLVFRFYGGIPNEERKRKQSISTQKVCIKVRFYVYHAICGQSHSGLEEG